MDARSGILYEMPQFLVTICLSVSYIFLSRFGTEYAFIVGEHESKPLLVSDAKVQRPTGRGQAFHSPNKRKEQ